MNNQDKILLSAFIDGDLNSNEEEYIDRLLKDDSEALSYLNAMKELDNRVNIFFESSLQSEEAKSAVTFAQNLKLGSEYSFSGALEKLKNFFTLPAILGYALSGALFFNIGTGNIALNGESAMNNLLAEYEYEEPYKKAFLKYRGLEQDNTNAHIEKTLNEMLLEKKGAAEITYGSKQIYIELKTKSDLKNDYDCFNGIVISEGLSQEFLFCKSSSGSSLLFK